MKVFSTRAKKSKSKTLNCSSTTTTTVQEPQSKRIKTTTDDASPSSNVTTRMTLSPTTSLQQSSSNRLKFDSPEVKDLLSYLLDQDYDNNDNEDEKHIERNWHNQLIPRLQKNGLWFYNLAKFVAQER